MSEGVLTTGVAYHGNRLLRHVEEDLRDIVDHNFNLVVHMLSHNDWDRHRTVMKEIVEMTEAHGLEVWLDNWGLGGPPGDKSHFLGYYPGSHQIYNTGEMDPVRACLNSQDFRKFTKDWVDLVEEVGGKTILWDEPHLFGKDLVDGKPTVWSCRCETCQALFREKHGHPMPAELTDEVVEFRLATIIDYFKDVTGYSAAKQMKNAVVVMLGATHGINLSTIERVAQIETMDNVGTDPYWYGRDVEPYRHNYDATKQMLAVAEKYGKGHNLWIQGFGVPHGQEDNARLAKLTENPDLIGLQGLGVPSGREEEIVLASEAAYDAGARTILVWGFRGSEGNDYRAECPDLTWKIVGDAMRRIQDRDRDAKLQVLRQQFRS